MESKYSSVALSLDSLRCFTQAARLLNFRAAARAVALSPAAFGQRIRQLEDDMGVRLFNRTTRSIAPTEAGMNLLPYAEKALAAVAECRRASAGELDPSPIEIVLGTRHELGLSWLLPLIGRLERRRSGLVLHLYFGSGPDLLMSVRRLAIDCAVTSTRLTDPKLDGIPLHEERYAFVAHPRLLHGRPLHRAQDAKRHTLLDATPELPLFRYLRDAPGGFDSVQFGHVLRLGTISAIRHRVLRAAGVAVLPEYFVAPDLRARRLVRVMPGVRPHSDFFRLVFRADDPRRSVYVRLAETMKAHPLR